MSATEDPSAPAPASRKESLNPERQTRRVDRFLKLMADRGASDLHLSAGRPPLLRLSGRVEAIRYRVINDRDFVALVKPITPEHLWKRFQETGDMDFAYEVPGEARFRVNLFHQQRGMGAVFRIIPNTLVTLDELGMPPALHQITKLESGLVLVTGPTGSGKSTTLAAVLYAMNQNRSLHVVTIEDPIEFVHDNQKSLFSQREVGTHSDSFADALRMALREDPDVILVGEMRDLETIQIALSAADTGLLVFGTLHTNSAAKTVDRIISVFPASRVDEVRGLLSGGLRAVVAQQLMPRKAGGRVAAVEVLFHTPALGSAIREGKTHQIPDIIYGGKQQGMVTMDDSIRALVEEEIVDPTSALEKAISKDAMRSWLAARGAEVPGDIDTTPTGLASGATGQR